MVFLPITTQSTQVQTTIPATSVPRSDLKRAADKAEPPAPNNDLESRLSSLLAGNNTRLNLVQRACWDRVVEIFHPKCIIMLSGSG